MGLTPDIGKNDEIVKATSIIVLQIPIVISLLVMCIQAYKSLAIKEFYFLSIAFGINLLYLLVKFSLVSFGVDSYTSSVITTIFDLISMYFFLLASIGICRKKPLDKTFYWVSLLIFLSCGLVKILHRHNKETDLVPFIEMHNIPDALLDCGVLILVALFFRSLCIKYHQSKFLSGALFLGTLVYALDQLLAIAQQDSFVPNVYMRIHTAGFTIGLLSKITILIGISTLLIAIGKEFASKEELATNLDDILGKTFHEITYPLNNLSGYINLLTDENKRRGLSHLDLLKPVESIETSYHHMIAIVSASMKMYERDIGKTFSNDLIKIPRDIIEPISVNTLIQIAILKIKPFTKERIEFDCDYGGNVSILCDPNQLTQVFQNLFKNSYEAMEGGIGYIKIKTRIQKDEIDSQNSTKYVKIEIADNGIGVPEHIKDRIFKVGSSSKNVVGRGYGMAVVKEIVEYHSGSVEVKSPLFEVPDNNRNGTLITLIFPKSEIII